MKHKITILCDFHYFELQERKEGRLDTNSYTFLAKNSCKKMTTFDKCTPQFLVNCPFLKGWSHCNLSKEYQRSNFDDTLYFLISFFERSCRILCSTNCKSLNGLIFKTNRRNNIGEFAIQLLVLLTLVIGKR